MTMRIRSEDSWEFENEQAPRNCKSMQEQMSVARGRLRRLAGVLPAASSLSIAVACSFFKKFDRKTR
jgi:hypothetical protein